jgi:hypothetical protein
VSEASSEKDWEARQEKIQVKQIGDERKWVKPQVKKIEEQDERSFKWNRLKSQVEEQIEEMIWSDIKVIWKRTCVAQHTKQKALLQPE